MTHRMTDDGRFVHSQCACATCEASRAAYIERLERAHAERLCPKRNARARAFHAWLRPALFAESLSTKTFRFNPEAGELADADLIDACEGHTGNFGGHVTRLAHGVRVTINTD